MHAVAHAATHILHTRGAQALIAVLQHDAQHLCTHAHVQIATVQMGRQIGLGSAAALPAFLRDLIQAHTFLAGGIEIRVCGKACLHTSCHKILAQGVGLLQIGHVQRPALGVKCIGTTLLVFGLEKPGFDVFPCPARIALCRPPVKVFGLTTQVDHGVDGAAASQPLATWLIAHAAAKPRLRHGCHGPVEMPGLGQPGQPARALQQGGIIDTTGLQHADLMQTRFTEPPRQHTA